MPTTRTTTTTTTKRTTLPSVKPPTIRVENPGGGQDPQKTTGTTTRTTVRHDGYQPVRPDRVCLPDLPHLYGSTGHLVGIDVSRQNGLIDWEAVREAGIGFAIIRCGYRTTEGGLVYADAHFHQNMQGALAAGIPVGVYFYSAAVNREEVLEEAAFVLEIIKGYDVTWPIGYDYEEFRHDRNQNTTGKTATDNAILFMDYVAQYGYTPMVYSSRNMLRDDFETGRLGSYRVWMAQYAELTVKRYDGPHALWQCCSDGLVPGIETPVDINIAYEDLSKPHEIYLSPQPETSFDGFTFTETWDTVTLTDAYRLRTSPFVLAPNTYATGTPGMSLVRTGVDEDNGWSRVLYGEQTLYVYNEGITYVGPAPPPTTTTTTTATTATESPDNTGQGENL
ncbi:MAG: hypothetical protein E7541_01855 [Ruminococcaceae bacterium]|nr:hypothetical protein [Oscillospiraceae bacterium]